MCTHVSLTIVSYTFHWQHELCERAFHWQHELCVRVRVCVCVCVCARAYCEYLSRSTSKPTKWRVRPAKTQISLGICPVWLVMYSMRLHADSEDSDHTRWMPMLIWAFAGRTCQCAGFVRLWLIWLLARDSLPLGARGGLWSLTVVFLEDLFIVFVTHLIFWDYGTFRPQ